MVVSVEDVPARDVARPGSAEELAEVVRQADDRGLAVAPIGGGTQLDLGNPPARLDLLVETTGLNRVVEYEPADLTITVEAGIRFTDLQATLGQEGQMLALDPLAAPEATIGGLVATNASGPLRFAHGTARDLVIGSRVANPDGALTRAGGRVELQARADPVGLGHRSRPVPRARIGPPAAERGGALTPVAAGGRAARPGRVGGGGPVTADRGRVAGRRLPRGGPAPGAGTERAGGEARGGARRRDRRHVGRGE